MRLRIDYAGKQLGVISASSTGVVASENLELASEVGDVTGLFFLKPSTSTNCGAARLETALATIQFLGSIVWNVGLSILISAKHFPEGTVTRILLFNLLCF